MRHFQFFENQNITKELRVSGKQIINKTISRFSTQLGIIT